MISADIPLLMDRVLAHLQRLRRRAAALLQEPLTGDELLAWSQKFPFPLSREIEMIYSWRNGAKANEGDLLEDLYLFPGFYFLSMEEAYETFLERREAPQWRKGWFPLFADGAGDYYIVTCGESKAESSVVIGFLHGEPEQIPEYDSLAAMLATLDAAYEQGAFFVDSDDSLEMDDNKYAEIARRFNPGISEWRS